MRVNNTIVNPKISLKRRPPQSVSKNILSDLFTLNFINKKPTAKFNIEKPVPSRIDLKIGPETSEIR